MLTDSHAHLSIDGLRDALPALISNAQKASVSRIVNIATTAAELERAIALHEAYPWIYPVGATTPHDVAKLGEAEFPFFEKCAREKKIVAIGETGLDYHYEHSEKGMQQNFLRRYSALALETGLPLIIHCREAFDDLFAIFDSMQPMPFVLHCFTGTVEEAKGVFERGGYLSFSGIITFKKSGELKEVAKIAPIDRLLIETDTPYLAPHPYRGRQNEPSYLVETAKVVAELRGISYENLALATTENAQHLFKI